MRITRITRIPAARYDTTAPGPTVLITALEPTNRPAPMIPPSAIIVMWRGSRPRWS
jgi:hypothetical protein